MSWASEAAAAGGAAGAPQQRPEDSNSTPPLPRQLIYPSERYQELAAAPPQRKVPSGLNNVGNTCYANSLLQSVLATPALAAYLVSGGGLLLFSLLAALRPLQLGGSCRRGRTPDAPTCC